MKILITTIILCMITCLYVEAEDKSESEVLIAYKIVIKYLESNDYVEYTPVYISNTRSIQTDNKDLEKAIDDLHKKQHSSWVVYLENKNKGKNDLCVLIDINNKIIVCEFKIPMVPVTNGDRLPQRANEIINKESDK